MTAITHPDNDQNALPFIIADVEIDAIGPDVNVALVP